MHGTNPIRHSEVQASGSFLSVQEIFYTIQGEGPQSGCRAVFIRLAGCNLACAFCDTEFESGMSNRLSIPEIIDQVAKHPHELVVLTGGEPMRQNVEPLIIALHAEIGVRLVQIETAGTIYQDCMTWPGVQVVCSPKTVKIHPHVAACCIHYKYVIESGRISDDDGLPCFGTQPATREERQQIFRPDLRTRNIYVSPCDTGIDTVNEANRKVAAAVAMQYGYRLSLQVHKLIGLP